MRLIEEGAVPPFPRDGMPVGTFLVLVLGVFIVVGLGALMVRLGRRSAA